MCRNRLRLPFELVRLPHIVRPTHRHVIAARLAKGAVECRWAAGVRLADDAHRSGEPLELARGAVGRAILNDDDLIGWTSLAEDRIERLADPQLSVVCGYDRCDGRRHDTGEHGSQSI